MRCVDFISDPAAAVRTEKYLQMQSIQVSTIAGSGVDDCIDGVGTAAAFGRPTAICYSEASGMLLVSDGNAKRIRSVPVTAVTERRSADLKRSLTAALMESGAIPIQLILIIHDFVRPYSMRSLLSGSAPALLLLCPLTDRSFGRFR